MKHRLIFLLSFALISFEGTAHAERIAVSIKPLHSLVAMVMEGIGTPVLLLSGTPHGGHLKPSQMQGISRADRVFIIDDVFEAVLAKPLHEKPGVVSLTETPGLKILDLRLNLEIDQDDHDHDEAKHDDHDDHDGHGHDEAKHDDHDGHGHGGHDHADSRDLHIWLDTDNAKRLIARIRDELIKVYPDEAAQLGANAEKAQSRIAALDTELAAELKPARGKRFVVFHDAYQYLEKKYGLRQMIAILDHHNAPMSAPRLQRLEHFFEDQAVSCIFSEPQFDPKLANLLAEKSGVGLAVIDPIGADIPAGPDHYPRLLKNIAASMRNCSG